MKRCLKMASSASYSSIAMPVLGTGHLKYPIEKALPVLLKAVHEFSSMKKTSLKVITFVVYDKDETTIQVSLFSYLFLSLHTYSS